MIKTHSRLKKRGRETKSILWSPMILSNFPRKNIKTDVMNTAKISNQYLIKKKKKKDKATSNNTRQNLLIKESRFVIHQTFKTHMEIKNIRKKRKCLIPAHKIFKTEGDYQKCPVIFGILESHFRFLWTILSNAEEWLNRKIMNSVAPMPSWWRFKGQILHF